MTEFSGLQKFACSHPETTQADEHGLAICVRCQAIVAVKLTAYMIDKAIEAGRSTVLVTKIEHGPCGWVWITTDD